MNQRLQLRDKLLKVLSTAQEKRPSLRNSVEVDGELAFVHYERHQIYDAVLRERQRLGKPPVALSAVKRVEQLAMGHFDYSSKFALYCAELVLDDTSVAP